MDELNELDDIIRMSDEKISALLFSLKKECDTLGYIKNELEYIIYHTSNETIISNIKEKLTGIDNINSKIRRIQQQTQNNNTKNYNGEQNKPQDKISVMLFYSPHCGWSRLFLQEWNKFVNAYKGKYDCKQFDCNDDKSKCRQFKIYGFPTVIIEKNGKLTEYNGKRQMNDMHNFIEAMNN